MSHDLISFACPTCGVQLRVPASMAGIKGPCPACSAPIMAPFADSDSGSTATASPAPVREAVPPAPEPEPALVHAQAATSQPLPVAPPEAVAEPAASPAPSAMPAPAMSDPFQAPAEPARTAAELPKAETAPAQSAPEPQVAANAQPLPASPAPFPDAAPSEPAPVPSSAPPAAVGGDPFGESAGAVAMASAESAAGGGNPPEPVPSAVSGAPATEPGLAASSPPPNTFPNAPLGSGPVQAVPTPAAPFPTSTSGPLPGGNAPGSMGLPQNPGTPLPMDYGAPADGPRPLPPGNPLGSGPPTAFPSAPPQASAPAPSDPLGSAILPLGTPPPGAPSNPGAQFGAPDPGMPSPMPSGFDPSPASLLPSGAIPGAPSGDPSFGGAPVPVGQPVPAPLGPTIGGGQPAPANASAKRRLRWPGIVFPFLFLVLAAIVVWLVLDLSDMFRAHVPPALNPNPPRSQDISTPNAAARSMAAQAARKGTPGSPITSVQHSTIRNEPPHLEETRYLREEGEMPLPPEIDLSEGEATPPPATPPATGSNEADAVLEQFLSATTLAERRSLMTKSKRSDDELAKSSLAKPFPPVVNRRVVHYMEDRTERHTERFYEVAFQKANDERAMVILVQLNDWGDGDIRVHADAFIDLFEEKLTEFAAEPTQGARTFHVIADAYKHCFDETIPNPDKKSFIKLRAHPRISPLMKAYFNRSSPMADEISKPDALPWGSSGICTVTVQWNTETPGKPFVELIKIEGFTWDP